MLFDPSTYTALLESARERPGKFDEAPSQDGPENDPENSHVTELPEMPPLETAEEIAEALLFALLGPPDGRFVNARPTVRFSAKPRCRHRQLTSPRSTPALSRIAHPIPRQLIAEDQLAKAARHCTDAAESLRMTREDRQHTPHAHPHQHTPLPESHVTPPNERRQLGVTDEELREWIGTEHFATPDAREDWQKRS